MTGDMPFEQAEKERSHGKCIPSPKSFGPTGTKIPPHGLPQDMFGEQLRDTRQGASYGPTLMRCFGFGPSGQPVVQTCCSDDCGLSHIRFQWGRVCLSKPKLPRPGLASIHPRPGERKNGAFCCDIVRYVRLWKCNDEFHLLQAEECRALANLGRGWKG